MCIVFSHLCSLCTMQSRQQGQRTELHAAHLSLLLSQGRATGVNSTWRSAPRPGDSGERPGGRGAGSRRLPSLLALCKDGRAGPASTKPEGMRADGAIFPLGGTNQGGLFP